MTAIDPLTCKERDAILLDPATGRPADGWTVHSSLTDLSGEFGEPEIRTTWERDGRLIQDIRHPDVNGGKDVAPCEHYELPREERDDMSEILELANPEVPR